MHRHFHRELPDSCKGAKLFRNRGNGLAGIFAIVRAIPEHKLVDENFRKRQPVQIENLGGIFQPVNQAAARSMESGINKGLLRRMGQAQNGLAIAQPGISAAAGIDVGAAAPVMVNKADQAGSSGQQVLDGLFIGDVKIQHGRGLESLRRRGLLVHGLVHGIELVQLGAKIA